MAQSTRSRWLHDKLDAIVPESFAREDEAETTSFSKMVNSYDDEVLWAFRGYVLVNGRHDKVLWAFRGYVLVGMIRCCGR